jgi:hypothetical protein
MNDRGSRYDAVGQTRERPPRTTYPDIGRPWSRDPARKVAVAAPDPGTPKAHHWQADTCARCALGRTEEWLLDAQDRAIVVLVWRMPGGRPIRVRPFPWFKGMPPPVRPLETVERRYPGVEVGSEPTCPGAPEAWVSLIASQLRASASSVADDDVT